jgi:hypothetical protein
MKNLSILLIFCSYFQNFVIYLLITIAKTSEFLLTSSVPDIESNSTVVSVESHGVNFDSESGDVLLLELTSQMALDESGLSGVKLAFIL